MLCFGQVSTQQAQAMAVRQNPELGRKGSALNQRFVSIYESERLLNPDAFQDPQWPLKIAQRAVAELKKELADAVTTPAVLGGCLDVTWGMSVEEARVVLAKRKGTAIDEKACTATSICFTGGTFNDQPVKAAVLEFFENRFFACTIFIKPKTTVQETWEQLTEELHGKYGDSLNRDLEKLKASWSLPNSEKETETVFCQGNFPRGDVGVTYRNSLLGQMAEAVQKAQADDKGQ
jgi:hypothetical protein